VSQAEALQAEMSTQVVPSSVGQSLAAPSPVELSQG
jgi:hypothetical protein